MGPKLGNEMITTPPKLTLTSFPCHKPLPATPGALTPPLQPMVSVPFQWEEVPGRPRADNLSSPFKPKSVRCLELPPRLLADANVAHMPPSPITVSDGPCLGRSLSHRFCFNDPSPKTSVISTTDLGLCEGKNKDEVHLVPLKWASGNSSKWHGQLKKGSFHLSSCDTNGGTMHDIDIEIKITRFRKRSNGSLYKLSHKGSRILESIYGGLKQMVVGGRKLHEKRRTEAT